MLFYLRGHHQPEVREKEYLPYRVFLETREF